MAKKSKDVTRARPTGGESLSADEKRRKLMARLDQAILHEIVRFVQSRSRVPGRVQIQKRHYEITYLDDHQQRLEDTLRRHDVDRLNMLFGQLASKVKYKLVRATAGRPGSARTPAKKSARGEKKPARAAKKQPRAAKKGAAAKKTRSRR